MSHDSNQNVIRDPNNPDLVQVRVNEDYSVFFSEIEFLQQFKERFGFQKKSLASITEILNHENYESVYRNFVVDFCEKQKKKQWYTDKNATTKQQKLDYFSGLVWDDFCSTHHKELPDELLHLTSHPEKLKKRLAKATSPNLIKKALREIECALMKQKKTENRQFFRATSFTDEFNLQNQRRVGLDVAYSSFNSNIKLEGTDVRNSNFSHITLGDAQVKQPVVVSINEKTKLKGCKLDHIQWNSAVLHYTEKNITFKNPKEVYEVLRNAYNEKREKEWFKWTSYFAHLDKKYGDNNYNQKLLEILRHKEEKPRSRTATIFESIFKTESYYQQSVNQELEKKFNGLVMIDWNRALDFDEGVLITRKNEGRSFKRCEDKDAIDLATKKHLALSYLRIELKLRSAVEMKKPAERIKKLIDQIKSDEFQSFQEYCKAKKTMHDWISMGFEVLKNKLIAENQLEEFSRTYELVNIKNSTVRNDMRQLIPSLDQFKEDIKNTMFSAKKEQWQKQEKNAREKNAREKILREQELAFFKAREDFCNTQCDKQKKEISETEVTERKEIIERQKKEKLQIQINSAKQWLKAPINGALRFNKIHQRIDSIRSIDDVDRCYQEIRRELTFDKIIVIEKKYDQWRLDYHNHPNPSGAKACFDLLTSCYEKIGGYSKIQSLRYLDHEFLDGIKENIQSNWRDNFFMNKIDGVINQIVNRHGTEDPKIIKYTFSLFFFAFIVVAKQKIIESGNELSVIKNVVMKAQVMMAFIKENLTEEKEKTSFFGIKEFYSLVDQAETRIKQFMEKIFSSEQPLLSQQSAAFSGCSLWNENEKNRVTAVKEEQAVMCH